MATSRLLCGEGKGTAFFSLQSASAPQLVGQEGQRQVSPREQAGNRSHEARAAGTGGWGKLGSVYPRQLKGFGGTLPYEVQTGDFRSSRIV